MGIFIVHSLSIVWYIVYQCFVAILNFGAKEG